MPQRYYTTDPRAGANFYQSYLTTGYPTVPSAVAELGVQAGAKVNGTSNTTWIFCNTGTASPVVNAGTAVAVNTSTFLVQSGTSTLNGTSLVPMVASVPGGLWLETSGATLNLTPLMTEAEEKALAEKTKAEAAAAHPEAHKADAPAGGAATTKGGAATTPPQATHR